MKGYFSLNKYHTEHHTYLIFGNLIGKCYPDPENLCICIDYLTEDAGRLIAHDVVEHKKSHRTSQTITAEDELQALGATLFVRPNSDITSDVPQSVKYLLERPIRETPSYDNKNHVALSTDDLRDMCYSDDVNPSDKVLEAVLDHINYGYWQKRNYYKGDQNKAYNDFIFIQDNVVSLAKECMAYYTYSGISFYFDTVEGTFRHQFKKQTKEWSFT